MTVDILGQGVDEIQDIGVTTYILEFFLCHLLLWLDSAEQDIETDSSSIESRFLRHQCELLAIFLYVKVGDKLIIELEMDESAPPRRLGRTTYEDFSRKRIIESLDQLNAAKRVNMKATEIN